MSELNKESVEQAGGDERAACNLWIAEQQLCQGSDISLFKLERNGALVSLHDLLRDAYQAGQARAALAQPSPDAPYADGIAADLERSDWTPEDALRWYAAGKHFDTVNGRTRIIDTGAVASNALKHLSLPYLEMKGDAELTELREAMAQPSPAQAEAERPEVVAYADPVAFATFKERGHEGGVAGREWMWAEPGAALVAMSRTDECERIVGALRAKADQLREALEWRKENQAGQRELLRSVTAERDAALARVEQQERTIAGMNEAHATLAGLYEAAQAQHSVPDGAADLCRFLAKLYCELDGLRYSTAKLPAEQIADALIFKWPVLQGARNQLNIKRISEQPYDESKLHSAIAAMLAAAPVCRLSRSALTEAQMRRLYENSTETENERLGFEAFARLIRRAEAVHQIAAAPAQGGE
ncbi:hypothetical protein P6M09_004547 [Pseudomonas aeruginosa]|nr:hypothetical protein [Pseudomonas aeruginosa]